MITGKAIKTMGFRGFIDITSVANSTVTATTTGKSYTAVCDSNGYARIKVGKKGDYQITSTGVARIGYATVIDKNPVTAVYRWHKYNAYMVYYNYVAQQINWRGETMYVSGSSFHYTSRSALNWDGTNGYWYANVNYITGSGIWPPSYAGSTRNTAYMMNPWGYGTDWRYSTHIVRAYYPRSEVYIREYTDGRIGLYNAGESEGAWVQDCYTGGYWAQGGTYYGIITATTLDAYPDNTTWDGEYWYIKI